MEEVTKCRYIDCVDTREKEQILHELPVCDTSLCVRWLINSGHVDLIGSNLNTLRSMKFFVCNNHFTEDCYLSKGTLKENAVPSPHWGAVSRTLRNLKTRRRVQVNGQESSMEEILPNHLTQKNAPYEFEVDQWCRTCATKKQDLVSMTTKGKGTDMSLLSKLKLLIEIDDEDALPTKMCDQCVEKLEQSFKFFQQIYVADNTLRHVFPNMRTSNTPRKPLYSIGEHMRNEQREKRKGKGKEKEKEKEEEEEEEIQIQIQMQQQQQQELQQSQDRVPKVSRGIFRRGRGRPRTRGYAARARSRQRSAQMQAVAPSSSVNNSRAYASRANETRNVVSMMNEERQGDTVFSLLTDTCRSDEELDWSDVLKVMSNQRYRLTPRAEIKPKIEKRAEIVREDRKAESNATSKAETTVGSTVELSEPMMMELTKTETHVRIKDEMDEKPDATTAITQNVQIKNQPERMLSEFCEFCEFCEQPFKFRHQLQNHLLTDHSQLSKYMCTDCLSCYESESLLSKHRSLRHGDRRYLCEHCQVEFVEKKLLREHVNKCRQPLDTSHYSCDSCGVTFASKQALIEHMDKHPQSSTATKESDSPLKSNVDDEAKSECSVAMSLNAIETSERAAHENSSSAIDDKAGEESGKERGEASAATCPDCNERTQGTVELSIHRMRRHSMNRKNVTCLLCDSKSFASLEEYEQHVLDHCKRLRISP